LGLSNQWQSPRHCTPNSASFGESVVSNLCLSKNLTSIDHNAFSIIGREALQSRSMNVISRVLRLAFAMSFVLGLAARPPEKEVTTKRLAIVLSVCDVLKNIETLNGQMITVRALIGWNQRHGITALAQENLDPYVQRCPGIGKPKKSWPPILQLESPKTLGAEDGAVTFTEKAPGLADIIATIREHERRTGKNVLIVTITGEIKTRSNMEIRRRGDDIVGNGYGQAGACPGLMVLETVLTAADPETHALVPILTGRNSGGMKTTLK
jgi:hypothetical protein